MISGVKKAKLGRAYKSRGKTIGVSAKMRTCQKTRRALIRVGGERDLAIHVAPVMSRFRNLVFCSLGLAIEAEDETVALTFLTFLKKTKQPKKKTTQSPQTNSGTPRQLTSDLIYERRQI